MKKEFYSNGKLLITGEYVVLDGALSLAIPTYYGQSLILTHSVKKGIEWSSLDEKGTLWFHVKFNYDATHFLKTESNDPVSKTLLKILQKAKQLNPNFLNTEEGIKITTRLNFPRNWGLGTSSTLINNIAQWAHVNAFTLLKNSFKGSGYDIAAAQNEKPILFQLQQKEISVRKAHLPWEFTDSVFFVHLNKKQDSKEGIEKYNANLATESEIQKISEISNKLLLCYSLTDFEKLLEAHEQIISKIIKAPTVKEKLFSDYPHTLKSLGAWGGDFILATGGEKDKDYFRKKGYATIIPFEKMIK